MEDSKSGAEQSVGKHASHRPPDAGWSGLADAAPRHLARSRRRWWLAPAVLGGAVIVGAALAAFLLWPRLSLEPSMQGVARARLGGARGQLSAEVVQAADAVPVTIRHGVLYPSKPLRPGEADQLRVSESVPGWIGWLAGSEIQARFDFTAPRARLVDAVSVLTAGSKPVARFSTPVSVVEWREGTKRAQVRLATASLSVPVGTATTGSEIGRLAVSAAPRPWETLSAPAELTWFSTAAPGQAAVAVTPPPGSELTHFQQPISFAFSEPVARIFGSRLPTLTVALSGAKVAGTWQREGRTELVFQPAATALWPGQTIDVKLPDAILVGAVGQHLSTMSTFDFTTPAPTTLALQEGLAELGYLPLRFDAAGGSGSFPTTLSALRHFASSPLKGSFAWRWSMPARLEDLWSQGHYTVVTKGALMAFERVEGLNFAQPRANPLLWPTLVSALEHHKVDPHPYVWIDVSKTLPEHIDLWSNGKIVIHSLANTGIPEAPTQDGTFPVYLRYQFHYMSGYNPNGTYYHDPVHWIAYFNGGDAVHGFYRPLGYGFPQSLGCVELPVMGKDPVAEQVWSYDHIGTLVSVHN